MQSIYANEMARTRGKKCHIHISHAINVGRVRVCFAVNAKFYPNSASGAAWYWLQNVRITAIVENAGKSMTSVLTPAARDYLILAHPLAPGPQSGCRRSRAAHSSCLLVDVWILVFYSRSTLDARS